MEFPITGRSSTWARERITAFDAGIWSNDQVKTLKQVARAIRENGNSGIGIWKRKIN